MSHLRWEERPRLRGRSLRLGAVGPIQLRELTDTNFGDRLLGFALSRRVFASLELAFDLNVSAFGQPGRVLADIVECDAAVPRGLRFVLARFTILPATFGRERQNGELSLIPGVTNFGILAEESNKHYAIAIHLRFSSSCSRDLLGAPKSERNRSQGQDLLFRGTAPQTGGAER